MEQRLYEPVHDEFRDLCREFLAREAVPYHADWEKAGLVDREVWRKAGAAGLLGINVGEEYGGGGQPDFRFNAVLGEEIVRAHCSGLGFGLHNDVVAPYLTELTTEDQRKRWLPGFCTGDIITAIAMSEPGAGSDLAGVRTTAVRDGDTYVLNGQKTFITNGEHADLVIVVAKTATDQGAHGVSLIAVERGTPGFTRGRRLEKVGLKANDTAELFFDDCRVPADNLIGTENHGFYQLMANLPRERLSIAVGSGARGGGDPRSDSGVRAHPAGLRPCDRELPAQPVPARRAGHRGDDRAYVHQPLCTGVQRRPAHDHRRGEGEVVDHGAADEGGRSVRATAWRVRLHDGVPGRQGMAGQPGADHLRRHHGNHEGDHRPRPRAVTR